MVAARTDHETRMKAFDLLCKLKVKNVPKKNILNRLFVQFDLPKGTLDGWYSNKAVPAGRKGNILLTPELFYVLGALLGDGCLYRWKPNNNFVILVGDENFAKKYAEKVRICTAQQTKAYPNRSQNIWFVKSNNFELYCMFEKCRKNLGYLDELLEERGISVVLSFIEGFFDAEGCVKIIKEKVRKTPKICLDMTNTNFALLELIRKFLEKVLDIEAKYSSQEAYIGKDGFKRQKIFHLRIYKKEFVRRFFETINTTKLKAEKTQFVKNWIGNQTIATLSDNSSRLVPSLLYSTNF